MCERKMSKFAVLVAFSRRSKVLYESFESSLRRVSESIMAAKLSISHLKTAKHLGIVWRDNAKFQVTLRVKIGAKKVKRFLRGKASTVVCTIHFMSHNP